MDSAEYSTKSNEYMFSFFPLMSLLNSTRLENESEILTEYLDEFSGFMAKPELEDIKNSSRSNIT